MREIPKALSTYAGDTCLMNPKRHKIHESRPDTAMPGSGTRAPWKLHRLAAAAHAKTQKGTPASRRLAGAVGRVDAEGRKAGRPLARSRTTSNAHGTTGGTVCTWSKREPSKISFDATRIPADAAVVVQSTSHHHSARHKWTRATSWRSAWAWTTRRCTSSPNGSQGGAGSLGSTRACMRRVHMPQRRQYMLKRLALDA